MMTREEAKEIFLNRGFIKADGGVVYDTNKRGVVYDANKWREACSVISKWLEQESCEDAVSRDDILNELNKLGRNAFKDDADYDSLFAFVEELSTVTPVKEKSQWTFDPLGGDWICTVCGNHSMEHGNYCPIVRPAEKTRKRERQIGSELVFYRCGGCGKITLNKENFCANCGVKFEED